MVMLGAMLASEIPVTKEAVFAAVPEVVKHKQLLDLNFKAIEAGIESAREAPAGA
jgi:Pyruvate/2-oxoacid:ferredoxin oxidoreductase gamma subunit